MTSKSRLYTIIAIGVFSVLSVAIVLTAMTVTRSNLTARSSNKVTEKRCVPVSADTLREALGAGNQGSLCNIHKTLILEVQYSGIKFQCGQSSVKENAEKAPSVKLTNANKHARYTLLMVDPDAPGHSLDGLRFWLHWAVTDIGGLALENGVVEGAALMEYMGPSPPKGSGVHRYQFILFESTKQENVQLFLNKVGGRGQFSLEDFVKKNGLCNIVGLFEFTVKADE